MSKYIELILGESGTTAVAELKDSMAPKSCKALLQVLPVEGRVVHARWGGNEVWMDLPPLDLTELENETILPSPGEILLVRVAHKTYHFVIFYGRGWCFGPTGFVPGNHFATIVENLTEFARVCDQVLLQGRKTLIVRER